MPELTDTVAEAPPKGTYAVQLAAEPERAENSFGLSYKWPFQIKAVISAADPNDFLDEEDEPVKSPEDWVGETFSLFSSTTLTINSKAGKWVLALLGKTAEELPRDVNGKIKFAFDWSDITLRYATADIGVNEKGYPSIDENGLRPYKPRKLKAQPINDGFESDQEMVLPVGRGRATKQEEGQPF